MIPREIIELAIKYKQDPHYAKIEEAIDFMERHEKPITVENIEAYWESPPLLIKPLF